MKEDSMDQQGLRRALDRYQRVAENIPGIVFYFDTRELKLSFLGEQFEEVFGLSVGEVERDASVLLELLEEPERTETLGNLRGAVRIRSPLDFRIRARTRQGRRSYEVRATPVVEGEALYYCGVALNVTEEGEMVERLNSLLRAIRGVSHVIVQESHPGALLQESCEILRRVRHYRNVWAMSFDSDGKVQDRGVAGEEEFFEVVVSKIESGTMPECVRRGMAEPGVSLRLGPDHGCKDCPISDVCEKTQSVVCGFNHGENARGVLSIDLEPGHEAGREEKELLAEVTGDIGRALQRIRIRERLRLRDRAIESSVTGISFVDLGGRVVGCNPAAVRMCGYQEESEVVGKEAREFCEFPDRARKTMRLALEQGQWSGEITGRCKDGSTFPVLASVSPVRDDAGNSTHVVVAFLDLTEQKQTEEKLQEALQELQEVQHRIIDHERHRALTQMASGIAHDFNNALSTIRGFTELLLHKPEKRSDEETLLKYLELIYAASSNAADTVRRLRKFYRPREDAELSPVDLNSIVHEAISITRPRWQKQAQAEGVNISIEEDLGRVPRVEGNEAELHEMLTNLIFNAVDAMEEDGQIRVTTRATDGEVFLAVSDSGCGMEEDTRRHCMDPFFTTKGDAGSGLGLSTTAGIVNRHGGRIEVESDPGEGTTFRIALRATEREAGADHVGEPADVGRQLSVLVAEDEEPQRELLREMLELLGHRADLAADGKEALGKLKQTSYDLIVTDRAMPRVRGDEVAEEVRRQVPDKPVILLTGFGDMMEAAGEEVEGVDALLSKPVTLDALRRAIHAVATDQQEE